MFDIRVFIALMSVDKKEHIMHVAMELFAEKGFEGTSIRDLAQKADVNIAMVNYYFGSKEKLFEQLLADKVQFMRAKIEAVESNESLTEIEKIDHIIDGYVTRFLAQPDFHRVFLQELLVTQRANLHQHVLSLFEKNTRDVVSIIEKGIQKKQFKKVDPQLTFISIVGTINQVMMSKEMCNTLMHASTNHNPYQDPKFKKRIIEHIQQMVHAHLIITTVS
ncbi:MAG: TetR family transcriptional regulator [Bacteroidetes bacterium]|nr:TetR family transcriptional regulator [Bacteroidota bacterium]